METKLSTFFYVLLMGIFLLVHSSRVNAQGFEVVSSFESQSSLLEANGVAVADYDLDGDLDVFLVASRIFDKNDSLTWSRLLRNDGVNGFADVTFESRLINFESTTNEGLVMGSKMGASWGDYDNDGDPDIFLTNYGLDELWRNEGNGQFTNITEKANVGGCQFCYSTTGLWWDYDLDGDLDLYVNDWIKENRLYRNDGNDVFVEMTDQSGLGDDRNSFTALPIDVNYDGLMDLYVANDAQENGLFLNNGNGTFVDRAKTFGLDNKGNGMGMDVCDYNNDGHFDIYVTNIYRFEPNPFFINSGDGLFSNRSTPLGIDDTGWGWGIRFFDADHDLDEDLYAVNGHKSSFAKEDRNRFFLNDEFGFKDISADLGVDNIVYAMGLEVFDYDNDGDFDMIVGNRDASSSFYKNTTIESGSGESNWLQIELEGTISNRNAFGSIVKITCDGVDYYRYHTGMNLFGHSVKPLHFGLANHTVVDQVEVTWPDGTVETYNDIESNQVLRIRESEDKKLVTGLSEDLGSTINLFPNPFTDRLAIVSSIKNSSTILFKLTNTAGKVVHSEVLDNSHSVYEIELPNSMKAGIYFYSLTFGDEILSGKVIRR